MFKQHKVYCTSLHKHMSLDTAENWRTIVEPGDLQGKIRLKVFHCQGRVSQQEAPSEPCLEVFENVIGVTGNFERHGDSEVSEQYTQ
jgi:hypothetical protein